MGQRIKEYSDHVLCLPRPTDYYNTGVVVFDVKRFNQMNAFEKLKEVINNNHLLYLEQDALNKCLFGHFYRLPVEWNYEFLEAIRLKYNQYEFYREYRNHEKDAKIVHFLGSIKPWRNSMEYRADLWWSYARRTTFYEEIVARMVEYQVGNIKTVDNATNATVNKSARLAYVSQHLLSFRWKKWRYQVKKSLLFGDKRPKYLDKYRSVRELIKEAKEFRKKMSEV
jgi:lipopolysaccharide biosynthesis glycosyltransferase